MACQSLSGSIVADQDNIIVEYDFRMPAENKPVLTGTALWNDTPDIKGNTL